MRKLYAAIVMMQKVEGPRVDTRPVLSVLWGTDLIGARLDAERSARDALPNMNLIETQAVQIPDDVIREAYAELPPIVVS
jgi:hypothetical protein